MTTVHGETVHRIRMMGLGGDETLCEYSIDDELAIAEAHKVFDEMIDRGVAAFARKVGASAEEAIQVREFDPSHEEVLMLRPVRGGARG